MFKDFFPTYNFTLETVVDKSKYLNQKLVFPSNYETQSEQLQGIKLFNQISKGVNVRGYVRC